MSKIKKTVRGLKGFTLLELVIVIAIISVLLMIIVPNMTDYIRTSRIRESNSQAQQIYIATQDYLNSLQTRGKKVEDYFGPKTGNVCKLGVESNHEGTVKYTNIRQYSNNVYGDGTFNEATVKSSKYMETAEGILNNLSEDFAGAWYVEVYPETYTVRVAIYNDNKIKCPSVGTYHKHTYNDGTSTVDIVEVYDYDTVKVIANEQYKSMFTVSNTESSGTYGFHGRTIKYAASQETCYNKGYETAYIGQYPIPAPTA